MKLLGALFVLSGTTITGFIIANSFIQRVKLLKELQTVLQVLETEISYGVNPLPEVFAKLEQDFSSPVAAFFAKAKVYLKEGETAQQAWFKAIEIFKSDTALSEEDIQTLKDLAHNFGRTSRKEQLKYLHLAQDKLNASIKEAKKIRNKNVKLCRYLGFLLGALIIILVF